MKQRLLATEVLDLPSGKLVVGFIETGGALAPVVCVACGSCGGRGCSACGGVGYTRLAPDDDAEVKQLLRLCTSQLTIASAVVDGVRDDIDLAIFPAAFRVGVAARLARYVLEGLKFKRGNAMCDLLARRAFAGEPELARSKEAVEQKNGL